MRNYLTLADAAWICYGLEGIPDDPARVDPPDDEPRDFERDEAAREEEGQRWLDQWRVHNDL